MIIYLKNKYKFYNDNLRDTQVLQFYSSVQDVQESIKVLHNLHYP